MIERLEDWWKKMAIINYFNSSHYIILAGRLYSVYVQIYQYMDKHTDEHEYMYDLSFWKIRKYKFS